MHASCHDYLGGKKVETLYNVNKSSRWLFTNLFKILKVKRLIGTWYFFAFDEQCLLEADVAKAKYIAKAYWENVNNFILYTDAY